MPMDIKQSVTSVPITLYVPEDVYKALAEIASHTGKSVSDLAQGAFALGFPKLPVIKSMLKKQKKR